MKDFYLKQDIENFLQENKFFRTKIYVNFEEMIKNEKQINTNCKNIYEYTDGLFNFNDSKCYFIAGEIYPNNQNGTNILFVHYDKNDIPVAMFVENNFCEVVNEVLQMVKKSKNYLSSHR